MTRLVLIDDDVNILNALKRVLRSTGWDIVTFSSPLDAIAQLVIDDVDLIMSDYRMPDMDGVVALNTLRDTCPSAVRLLMSGHADLDGVLKAINQAEIYRFVVKPWDDADLIMTLESALKYQAMVQENIRLADLVRSQQDQIQRQQRELQRLEQESPGITHVDRDADGSIDLSGEFDEDALR
jgi:two-component system, probable response regulator PhcQ